MARELQINLQMPGMTPLHRAGLAGIYLTLKALDKQGVYIPDLDWRLSSRGVFLSFKAEKPGEAFKELIRRSFKTDEIGFFSLPGIEFGSAPDLGYRHHLYEALKGTFLQFGPHCKSGAARTLVYEIDDKPFFIKKFSPLMSYKHQESPEEFLTGRGDFKARVEIKSWLYPGGSERHSGLPNTGLSESLELALCLLYAPIGVLYYRLRSSRRGAKAKTAIVIPDVKDLDEYWEVRRTLLDQSVLALYACGPVDAALRYLLARMRSTLRGAFSPDQIEECVVVCFGTVSWNQKQKTRTYVTRLTRVDRLDLETYKLADSIFKNRWQMKTAKAEKKEDDKPEYFSKVLTARELIAENCAAGRVWYQGFGDAMADKNVRQNLIYEGRELAEMLVQSNLAEQDRIFVQACQEAWRRRMGQLGQRAKSENTDFSGLINRERDRLRSALLRCKNADTLRETVIGFWSRAGSLEVLRDSWPSAMQFFSAADWKKGKDLALLALIAYKPSDKQEEEALNIDEGGADGDE